MHNTLYLYLMKWASQIGRWYLRFSEQNQRVHYERLVRQADDLSANNPVETII